MYATMGGKCLIKNKKNLIRIKVATIFTHVTDFDNEQKFASVS